MNSIKIATIQRIEFFGYYELKKYQRFDANRLTLRRYPTINQKIIVDETRKNEQK